MDRRAGLDARGALVSLPEAWLTASQRARARIPEAVEFQEKWRLALTLVRRVRAAGFDLTGVVGDAEFGDNATLRRTLHRATVPYALGVSCDLKVFPGTPSLQRPAPLVGKGRPRTQRVLAAGTQTVTAMALVATQPARAWRRVSWRNGTNPPWRAAFVARRVTPAHDWRERRLAPEVWLLAERDLSAAPRTKYYLVDLPPSASLKALVRFAHQRWAIEQQYQELKDEIGLDHFEGRTLPGWQRHVVLTAIAYSFLQNERRRRGQTQLTLPRVRAVIQEVLTAHFFMTQPHYLKWMLKLKDVELRI
ncbi:MAG: IS701 family transposase [Vicinamibacteraceae bacterium]